MPSWYYSERLWDFQEMDRALPEVCPYRGLSVWPLSASSVGKECDLPVLWVWGQPHAPSSMPFCHGRLCPLWNCEPKRTNKKNPKQVRKQTNKNPPYHAFCRDILFQRQRSNECDAFHRKRITRECACVARTARRSMFGQSTK